MEELDQPRRVRKLDGILGGPGSTRRLVTDRRLRGETIEAIAEHLSRLAATLEEGRVAPNTLRYWIREVWTDLQPVEHEEVKQA